MRDEEDSRDLQTDGLGMWQRPDGWESLERPIPPPGFPLGSPPNPFPQRATIPRETPRAWPPFDLLSWRQFEQAAAEAFRAQGYAVQLTRDGADGGVDLILDRDGERTLVQCKHWAAWKVGVKTVRELYGVMTAQGVGAGIVVTSGRFTEEARDFASGVPVRLLDGRDVAAMLDGVPVPEELAGLAAARSRPDSDLAWGDAIAAAHSSARRTENARTRDAADGPPRCPRCGEPMVMRTASRGQNRGTPFWGCPRYPVCRGMVRFAGAQQIPDRSAPPAPGSRPLPGHRRPPRPTRSRSRSWVRALIGVAALLIGLGLTRPIWGTGGEWLGAVGIAVAPAVDEPADPPLMGSIKLPERPHQVAVDSAGRRLFVTHRDASSITVVDLNTKQAVATWPVAQQPLGIAFDPVEQVLWVTNYNDASVTVLTPGGKHVTRLRVGQGPEAIAVDGSAGRAYVVNSLDNSLSIVDTGTVTLLRTQALGYPTSGVAVDSAQKRVCLVRPPALNMVFCHDEEFTRTGMYEPVGDVLAIDSVRHDRYGVDRSLRTLTAADALTGDETTVNLEHTPTGIAVDEVTRMVYVALPDDTSIWMASPLS